MARSKSGPRLIVLVPCSSYGGHNRSVQQISKLGPRLKRYPGQFDDSSGGPRAGIAGIVGRTGRGLWLRRQLGRASPRSVRPGRQVGGQHRDQGGVRHRPRAKGGRRQSLVAEQALPRPALVLQCAELLGRIAGCAVGATIDREGVNAHRAAKRTAVRPKRQAYWRRYFPMTESAFSSGALDTLMVPSRG